MKPPFHELACLRNALLARFRVIGWRWYHRTPRSVLERMDREIDYMRRGLCATQLHRIERKAYDAARAWGRLTRGR